MFSNAPWQLPPIHLLDREQQNLWGALALQIALGEEGAMGAKKRSQGSVFLFQLASHSAAPVLITRKHRPELCDKSYRFRLNSFVRLPLAQEGMPMRQRHLQLTFSVT